MEYMYKSEIIMNQEGEIIIGDTCMYKKQCKRLWGADTATDFASHLKKASNL